MWNKCTLDSPCVYALACRDHDPRDLLEMGHAVSGPNQSQWPNPAGPHPFGLWLCMGGEWAVLEKEVGSCRSVMRAATGTLVQAWGDAGTFAHCVTSHSKPEASGPLLQSCTSFLPSHHIFCFRAWSGSYRSRENTEHPPGCGHRKHLENTYSLGTLGMGRTPSPGCLTAFFCPILPPSVHPQQLENEKTLCTSSLDEVFFFPSVLVLLKTRPGSLLVNFSFS